RYDAFFVPQPLRILVVETRPGARIFEEESFFVSSALDPLQGKTNSNASRFSIEKVSPEELMTQAKRRQVAALQSGQPGQTNYDHDVVIVPGLKRVPGELGGALSGFVRAGGGLVLFLNENVSPSGYNTELRDLLPAQLGRLEGNTAQPGELKWRLDEYDLKAAMFAPFRRPGSGNLALPEFSQRFTLTT